MRRRRGRIVKCYLLLKRYDRDDELQIFLSTFTMTVSQFHRVLEDHEETSSPLSAHHLRSFAIMRRTSLKQTKSTAFSIMSYNLLAPIYVRPIDTRTGKVQEFASFRWCQNDDVLCEKKRAKKLRQQIQDSQADIVCLQEVQFVYDMKQWKLPSWLDSLTEFKSILPDEKELNDMAKRNERVLKKKAPVANAILFRHERFEMQRVMSKRNQRVAATLRCVPKGESVFVASLHLDATDPHKRSAAIRKCVNDYLKSGCSGIVMAGDMNSEFSKGTVVSAILKNEERPSLKTLREECFAREVGTEKELEKYVKEWDRSRMFSKKSRCLLRRVPTQGTRSGFDHGKIVGPCVSWALDHILFSESSLKLKTFWDTLEKDSKSSKTGLPNEDNPSDHIPVAAVFEWIRQDKEVKVRNTLPLTKFEVLIQEMKIPQQDWMHWKIHLSFIDVTQS